MHTVLSALISKLCVCLKRSKWSQFPQNDWTWSFSSAQIFVDEFHENSNSKIVPAFLFSNHKYRLMWFSHEKYLQTAPIWFSHELANYRFINRHKISADQRYCERHHRSFTITIVGDHYARTGSTNYVHCVAIKILVSH